MLEEIKILINKYPKLSAIIYGALVGAAFSHVFFPLLAAGYKKIWPLFLAFILMFVVVEGLRAHAQRYWAMPLTVMKAMVVTFWVVLALDTSVSIWIVLTS